MTDTDRTRIAEPSHPVAGRRALRAIAAFEATKGIAAFAALIGVVDLMHHDVHRLALELIGHFNLNPDARYPSILLRYADLLPGADLRALFVLAFGYILLRLCEAYGLWNDRTWGEWLATLSGALYIPFEIVHIAHRPSIINALVLAGNIFVIGFLALRLWRKHRVALARQ